MKLHEDIEAFTELVEVTAENIGLPQIYVEKDYWVTKALKHLSKSEYVGDVVFKGGTSLSKAYRLIERFSEDIDLAVLSGSRSDSARKKLLKSVESVVAQDLQCIENDERESKGSRYRKTVYQYPRQIEGNNFGQASQELLIEVNAFTHPEPYEAIALQTLIAETLSKRNEVELIEKFNLGSFSINVLSVRRALVEKMLGVIKDSYHVNPINKLTNRIRHLYDIGLIMRENEFKEFVKSDDFKTLCQLSIEDEKAGFFDYSDCLDKPLAEAPIFTNFKDWQSSLTTTYHGAFSDLVYGELPHLDEISNTLDFLYTHLK